jgi:transposase
VVAPNITGRHNPDREVAVAGSIWQVRDDLLGLVEQVLPTREPSAEGGRPRVDDRVCFDPIVFVPFTGIAWRHLPRELGPRRPRRTGGSSTGNGRASSSGCTGSCREG